MLWFLRKAFGIIALAWVALLLLTMASCLISREAGAAGYLLTGLTSWVGVPASIIWAVLKVISVFGARRVEQPATVVAYPPNQGAPSGVLRLAPPVPVREVPRTETRSSSSSAGREVYTYSAPGMAMCPECGSNPVVFYCSRHHHGMCLDCVAKHDNAQECVYLPAFRAPKAATGPGTTSEETVRKAKLGDVFGIS